MYCVVLLPLVVVVEGREGGAKALEQPGSIDRVQASIEERIIGIASSLLFRLCWRRG